MKNWILRWLGLGPKGIDAPVASFVGGGNRLIETKRRNFFEIIDAVNGKIVVYTRNEYNQNGPDKNDMEVYLVHDGDNLMDTITTAIVSAGLK
jgi:hypothetical protein